MVDIGTGGNILRPLDLLCMIHVVGQSTKHTMTTGITCSIEGYIYVRSLVRFYISLWIRVSSPFCNYSLSLILLV